MNIKILNNKNLDQKVEVMNKVEKNIDLIFMELKVCRQNLEDVESVKAVPVMIVVNA